MRRLTIVTTLLVSASFAPRPPEITPLERQRLIAHLDMTGSWFEDEVSNLSQAQLDFHRAPGTWSIMEVVEHLVMVGQIYWDDLQRGLRTPRAGRPLSSQDVDLLWYGI